MNSKATIFLRARKPLYADSPDNSNDEAGDPGQGAGLVEGRGDHVSLTKLALDAHRRLAEMLHHRVGRLLHYNGACLSVACNSQPTLASTQCDPSSPHPHHDNIPLEVC